MKRIQNNFPSSVTGAKFPYPIVVATVPAKKNALSNKLQLKNFEASFHFARQIKTKLQKSEKCYLNSLQPES